MKKSILFALIALNFAVVQAFADYSEEPVGNAESSSLNEESSEAPKDVARFVYVNPSQQGNASDVTLTNPSNYADSVTYYNRLANEQEFYGGNGRKSGLIMFIPGILGAVGGIALASYVIVNDTEYCKEIYQDDMNYECKLNGKGALLMFGGIALGGTGLTLTTIGTIKLITSGKKLRRSKEYRQKAQSFSDMMQNAQLYLKPEVDLLHNSLGAKFALAF